MHLDLTFQVYTFVMRCFGMCIFDPRRLLKRSRAVFKNKWLMEGLSVRNTILLEFCSDVNSVLPPAPPHPQFFDTRSHDSLPLLTSYLYHCFSSVSLHLLLVRKDYIMFWYQRCQWLHSAHIYLWLLPHVPHWPANASAPGELGAKRSLLAAWGNTIRAYFSYYNRKRNLEDFVEFFSDWK